MTVHELVLRDFSARELTLSVPCSKGFFVRSLARDLGRALGSGAHLKALRRTASGPFKLAQAMPLELLEKTAPAELAALLQPRLVGLNEALVELPELRVSDDEAKKVSHGVPLEARGKLAGRVRVVADRTSQLLAVAEIGPGGRVKYARVLV